MSRDYAEIARSLRRKAADPVVPEPERLALLEKAIELEAKYGNSNSTFRNDTTVTSRTGQTYSAEYWMNVAEDLLRNQWQWNREYYDRYGNPKTPTDDVYDDDFAHSYAPPNADYENEDYGYEEYQ